MFNMMSLDGFFAGPNGDISWHYVDKEFNDFAVQQLDEAGTLLFGRVTYQLMAGYWPTQAARTGDPVVAGRMNDMQKIVVSRTLPRADWENTRVVKDNVEGEILRLKKTSGKDIAIMGSSVLLAGLMKAGLVDEIRIMVNPVILGAGRPLFAGGAARLKLLWCRAFRSGNVLLTYRSDAGK